MDDNADASLCSQDQCYAALLTVNADLIQSYFRGGKRGCLILAVETIVLKKPSLTTMIWVYFQR